MSNQHTMIKYTNDEVKQIISLYNEGMSFTKISVILHRQKNTIKKILIENGIFIKDKNTLNKIFTKNDINLIKEKYINGESCLKIGNYFNTSKVTISKILKKEDLLRKGYSNGQKIVLTNEQKEAIKNFYLNEYKNSKEIAEIINLNENFVNSYLTKSGFRRNKSDGVSVGLVKRFSGLPYNEYLKNRTIREQYKSDVMKITNKQNISSLSNFEKRGVSGINGAYHLDHKFSITEGFKNNISPKIIGDINNLEFIPWEENIMKRTKCSINKEELLKIK